MLNAGLGFSDEFEMEVCNYHEKSSNRLKQQYREWKSTVKREGTALFNTVKSVVSYNFKLCFIIKYCVQIKLKDLLGALIKIK